MTHSNMLMTSDWLFGPILSLANINKTPQNHTKNLCPSSNHLRFRHHQRSQRQSRWPLPSRRPDRRRNHAPPRGRAVGVRRGAAPTGPHLGCWGLRVIHNSCRMLKIWRFHSSSPFGPDFGWHGSELEQEKLQFHVLMRNLSGCKWAKSKWLEWTWLGFINSS